MLHDHLFCPIWSLSPVVANTFRYNKEKKRKNKNNNIYKKIKTIIIIKK
jgi:enterochelin esterase-like enzyme